MQLSVHYSDEALRVTSHGPNPITSCVHSGVVIPVDQIGSNLIHLASRVLEPLLDRFGWQVSSCYRCPVVNRAIGGSPSSAHMLGLACDGAPGAGRGTFADVVRWLASDVDGRVLPVDRVIYEFRKDGRGPNLETRWLHVQALPPTHVGAIPLAAFYFSPRPLLYQRVTPDALAGLVA